MLKFRLKHIWKKTYRLLRRPFEWLLIGLAYLILPRLSYTALLRVAHFIATLVYRFDGRSRKIVHENLALMYPGRISPWREKAITVKSFRNMAKVLLTLFWLSRDSKKRVQGLMSIKNEDLELIKSRAPMVLISAHLGNWEISSQVLVAHGIPVISVAKKIGSSLMTKKLVKMRSAVGQQIIPVEGALRPLIRALRQGQNVGLVVDQHINPWEGGTWVDFFGVPASFTMTPALLSRMCKVPVLFVWSRPLSSGKYSFQLGRLHTYDAKLSDQEKTVLMVQDFETIIRRHPSLWCLNYKLWRFITPGNDISQYPAYARVIPEDILRVYANRQQKKMPHNDGACKVNRCVRV